MKKKEKRKERMKKKAQKTKRKTKMMKRMVTKLKFETIHSTDMKHRMQTKKEKKRQTKREKKKVKMNCMNKLTKVVKTNYPNRFHFINLKKVMKQKFYQLFKKKEVSKKIIKVMPMNKRIRSTTKRVRVMNDLFLNKMNKKEKGKNLQIDYGQRKYQI